jgi:hypothetical protein
VLSAGCGVLFSICNSATPAAAYSWASDHVNGFIDVNIVYNVDLDPRRAVHIVKIQFDPRVY